MVIKGCIIEVNELDNVLQVNERPRVEWCRTTPRYESHALSACTPTQTYPAEQFRRSPILLQFRNQSVAIIQKSRNAAFNSASDSMTDFEIFTKENTAIPTSLNTCMSTYLTRLIYLIPSLSQSIYQYYSKSR
jgi:hypothetical protein